MSADIIPQENLKSNSEDPHRGLLSFFNAMDEVFFSTDFMGAKITVMSDACEQLFGYKAADFLNNYLLWLDLVHPEDRHIVSNQNELLQKGKIVNSEYRIIRKDNAVKWVEKKIVPVLNSDGILVRLDGVIRDITSKREDEEKHRKSEAMYRHIVETAQEGIWMIDEYEQTVFVNQAVCDMLEYTSDEMQGKKIYDFMDAEGVAYATLGIQRRRKGAKEKFDIRYIAKSGRNVRANISTNPIFNETGVYKGALAMVTDITDRKADEEALKNSEANLRTIFDNADSSYILFDANSRIVSFNTMAQKYSEEHNNKMLVTNELMSDYFSEDRWPIIQKLLKRVADGEIVQYELNFNNEDGTAKWHNIRWLNVKNSDNENRGYILVNTDITESKTAALEREKITADLIQRNNELEQFTYIVSHNLRAPVANIIGLSDMLVEDELDAEMRQEILSRVHLSIKNIDFIIKDLNQILQSRAINENKEMVNFENLVDGIKNSLFNAFSKEEVQFKCDFDELASIFTIRSYLYSIFYNLISNSIKYRRTNVPGLITIKSRLLENKAELIFTDNGKGIDLEKNGGQLFGLYKRFDTTTEGKGMGLFMVKTQIETLGGSIEVQSKLGEGTEFTIHFNL